MDKSRCVNSGTRVFTKILQVVTYQQRFPVENRANFLWIHINEVHASVHL